MENLLEHLKTAKRAVVLANLEADGTPFRDPLLQVIEIIDAVQEVVLGEILPPSKTLEDLEGECTDCYGMKTYKATLPDGEIVLENCHTCSLDIKEEV